MDFVTRLLATSALYFATTLPLQAAPLGSYVGVLPCADCPAIDYRLDLLPEGVYFLRMSYREREGGRDEVGRWSMNAAGQALQLDSMMSERTLFKIEDEDKLTLLDQNGLAIESSLNYSLYRSQLLAPIVPQVRLQGTFSHYADSSRLVECATGLEMPVAMEGEHLKVERAWREAGGGEVLMELAGRIEQRVNMEGPLRPMLVVERLIAAKPAQACPESRKTIGPVAGAAAFAGTQWLLVQLNGRAVVPTPRPAFLEFRLSPDKRVSGSSGCNRLTGAFERQGEALRFKPLASTRMLCADAMNQEQAMLDALEATRTHRIEGGRLLLLGDAGKVLAEFAPGSAE